jgi:hypothetical protein
MEIKGAALLYTLATVMITFGGFCALLLAIRQAAGALLGPLDRYLAKTILIQLCTLTAGTFLPPLLALYDVSEFWLWRIAAVCFAIPMLALLLTQPHRRRKATGKAPPPAVFAVFIVLGSGVVAGMLIYVIGDFEYKAAAYVTSLITNFFTTVFAFVTALDVIMQEPADFHRE